MAYEKEDEGEGEGEGEEENQEGEERYEVNEVGSGCERKS